MSNTPDQNTEMTDDTEAQTEDSLFGSIGRAAVGLAIFAVVTAGLIALTQVTTKERIEDEIRKARSKALLEIVPAQEHDNDLLNDAFFVQAQALGLTDPSEVFIAKQGDKVHSIILPVVAQAGYSGPIRLIVGLEHNGVIRGVRVVEHKETPGLGDKIETKKSDWILGFDGRSLVNTPTEAWQVKKDGGDFDQLTGATITPRAIVQAVYGALQFYQEHQLSLVATQAGQYWQAPAKSQADSTMTAQDAAAQDTTEH